MPRYIFWIILLLSGILLAVPIAWVEDLPIESEEYQQALQELPDSLNMVLKRHTAMEKLIEQKLLLLYAQEQEITVSEEETEALFINTFGDHPSFSRDGSFDYDLFKQSKSGENLQRILMEMEKDIRIEKTKALINKRFELDEDELLERFFLENMKIDASYGLFDLEDVSISTQLTVSGAKRYYRDHQEQFREPEKFKLGFCYIPEEDFYERAQIEVEQMELDVLPYDLLGENTELDSVEQALIWQEAEEMSRAARETACRSIVDSLLYAEASRVQQYLQNGLPVNYARFSSGYISEDSPAGSIPPELIVQGKQLGINEVSEPVEMGDGLLLFWQIDRKAGDTARLEGVKDEVWDRYIQDVDFQDNEGEFQSYFYSNLDEFKVPALIVNRIDLVEHLHGRSWPIVKNKAEIIAKLEKYLFNEEYLSWAARSSGLEMQTETIYLEKYAYKDEINRRISESVSADEVYGVVSADGIESFFVLNSIYPSYLPQFEEVLQSGYFQSQFQENYDEASFQEYFLEHEKDFATADSVALAGVIFTLETDSVMIDSSQISNYYLQNQSEYYHEDAVECRFIVTIDQERAMLASQYLRSGYDHELVKWCFNDRSYSLEDGIWEYSQLAEKVSNILYYLPEKQYSRPVQIAEGWLIIYKGEEHPEGYFQKEEVVEKISERLKLFRADSLAFSRAKAVFDSTTYFSECYTYADARYIFKTPLRAIDSEFPRLGDISHYSAQLMRLWGNEKLTRIVKVPEGYAVLFMRQKRNSRSLSYEESKDKISEIFASNYQIERGKTYLEGVINDLKAGVPEDSLLYFLGGLQHEKDISLNTELPGFPQSSVIVQDMTRHQAGYYSPVIKLSNNKLMFYRINQINKVSRQDFYKEKRAFRESVQAADYRNWLLSYRQSKQIKQ